VRITGLAVLFVAVTVQSAFGSLSFVSTRGGLSGSDSLFISTIGPDGTGEPSAGFVVDTTNSNAVTISDTGGDGFTVLQEGNDWSGNFANNDLVLWTNGDAVPTTLAFGTPVLGVGMQIEPDCFSPGCAAGTGNFTASISAFDSSHTLLGSFTENGVSNDNNDNSAIFIGVLSTASNVASIAINITAPAGMDYAFNELTFSSTTTTPEPSSLALLLCGAGIFAVIVWKRRRAIVQQ
jgi:hypothetical protein